MPNGSSVASPGGQAGAVTGNSAGPTPGGQPGALTEHSGGASQPDPPAAARPVLSVLRGEPTEAELAAVITVLAARSAAAAFASRPAPASASRSSWSANSRLLRAPLQAGPGGWRRSALPR
jgi:hypothetical protein